MATFRFTRHALDEMVRRGISQALVESVLDHPQQIVPQLPGRVAYQSQIDFGGGRMYLVRVIVEDVVDPAVVVTVYRTSKITKYWSMKP